jgi:hypothetical protein
VLCPDRAIARGQVVLGAGLKKLLKFKTWLTVPDAARHLSILFGEDVTEADVLRFALDGHLTLSVDFVNQTTARCGKIIPLADAEIREVKSLNGDGVVRLIRNGIYLGEERVFSFSSEPTYMDGIWDLAMLGAERLDVEHSYQLLTDGPAVTLAAFDGPLVSHPDGTWCQLLANYKGRLDDRDPDRLIGRPYRRKDHREQAEAHPRGHGEQGGRLTPSAIA